MLMFSTTDSTKNSPDFLRSSVRNARPSSIAFEGESTFAALPSIKMLPPSAGCMPNRLSITSLRPAPTSPATPRISPRLTLNETSWNQSERRSPSTRSTSSPILLLNLGNIWVSSRPTIMVISDCLVRFSVLSLAIKVPSRKMLTSSVMAKISSILWLM
ncbi:hypothetical protein D3C72_1731890 [compost metagenome]